MMMRMMLLSIVTIIIGVCLTPSTAAACCGSSHSPMSCHVKGPCPCCVPQTAEKSTERPVGNGAVLPATGNCLDGCTCETRASLPGNASAVATRHAAHIQFASANPHRLTFVAFTSQFRAFISERYIPRSLPLHQPHLRV